MHVTVFQGGSVSCSSVQCPRLSCSSPVRRPGKCCPTCPESECVLVDQVYRHGQVFRHPRDRCRRCTCDVSMKTCPCNMRMSCIMRKPTFCVWGNKGADVLPSYCEADQCLCFRYTDSTIPLLSKSKISSH